MAIGDAVNVDLDLNATFTPAVGVTVMITQCGAGSNDGYLAKASGYGSWTHFFSGNIWDGKVKLFLTNSSGIKQISVGTGTISGIQIA